MAPPGQSGPRGVATVSRGSHSAWLVKEKGDASRTKWLQSSARRYFTIDFDRQVVFYTHSSAPTAAITASIPFREILGASMGRNDEVSAANSPSGGLRRSYSGTLTPPHPGQARRGEGGGAPCAFGGSTTHGAGNVFVLHTQERKIRLTADQEAEAHFWVDLLNRAHALGAVSTEARVAARRAVEATGARRQRDFTMSREKPPAISTPSAASQVSTLSTTSGSTSTSSPAWSEAGEASSDVRVELEEEADADFGLEPSAVAEKDHANVVVCLEEALQRNNQEEDREQSAAQPSEHTLTSSTDAEDGVNRWSRRLKASGASAGPEAKADPEPAVAEGPRQLTAADFGFDEDLPDAEEDEEEDQDIAAHLEAELQKRQAAFQRVLEGGAPPAPEEPQQCDDDGAAAAAAAKEERRRARHAARVAKQREQEEAWAQQTAADLAAGDQQLAARMTADLLLARGVCAGKAGSTAPRTSLRERNTDTRENSSAGEWEQRRSVKRGEEEELKCSRGSKHSHDREEMRGARHSSKARGQRASPLAGDMESRIAADLQLAQRHQQRLVASM